MREYLVIWRGEDNVIQSIVESETEKLTPDEWVKLAAISEGCDENAADEISKNSFDLYAVIKGPVTFAY